MSLGLPTEGTVRINITLPGVMEERVTARGAESKGGRRTRNGQGAYHAEPQPGGFLHQCVQNNSSNDSPTFFSFSILESEDSKTMTKEGSQEYNSTMQRGSQACASAALAAS